MSSSVNNVWPRLAQFHRPLTPCRAHVCVLLSSEGRQISNPLQTAAGGVRMLCVCVRVNCHHLAPSLTTVWGFSKLAPVRAPHTYALVISRAEQLQLHVHVQTVIKPLEKVIIKYPPNILCIMPL